jgi:GGDEF domain-containing protein
MRFFDHIDPTKLERRDAQLWMLALAMLAIFAVGIALLIYPAAFTMPVVLSGSVLKGVFFGFCALSMLVVGYLMERRIEIGRLRRRLKEEESRRQRLLNEASADLLASLPGVEHFRDRLAMEFRRAVNAELPLSLVLVSITPAERLHDPGDIATAYGDAAKAMIRKLRGEDSIYLFRPGVFGVVLPGVLASNARRVEGRLSEGLAAASGDTRRFSAHSHAISFPEDVGTAHEMERAAKLFAPEGHPQAAAA